MRHKVLEPNVNLVYINYGALEKLKMNSKTIYKTYAYSYYGKLENVYTKTLINKNLQKLLILFFIYFSI